MSDPLVLLQIIVAVKGFLTLITVMTRLHMRSQISFAGVNSATKLVWTNDLWTVVAGGHVSSQ